MSGGDGGVLVCGGGLWTRSPGDPRPEPCQAQLSSPTGLSHSLQSGMDCPAEKRRRFG